MATLTGKRVRRSGGNRYACKRRRRHTNHEKRFIDNVMSPEEYRKHKR